MKLLVLGPDQGEDPLGATNCFAFMAAALMREFSRIIPGSARLVNVDMASDLGSIQGEADFVLFIGYTIVWNRLASCLPEIRKRTGYKKIAVMSDYSFFLNRDGITTKPDWSFCFLDDDDPRSTVLCAPCVKSYYANEPKEKTILIDHGMIRHKGTEKEWTFRVSDWLEPLKDRYKILRTVQDPEYEVPTPHEVAFPTVPFTEYLKLTNHVESFVITHDETYGYQVIDMIARGIRVVTPEGFLHRDLVKLFQIPTFKSGEELRAILESPVEPRWDEMVNRCTDYS
jgi:hypothetical protein